MKSWDKKINDDYYYIRLEGHQVVFGDVFEGGKSGLEIQCAFDEFLEDSHEVNLRIKEIFDQEIIDEVKSEILRTLGKFSKELDGGK